MMYQRNDIETKNLNKMSGIFCFDVALCNKDYDILSY